MVDCRTFFNYYRLTPDNRIIMGGGRVTLPPGVAAGSPRSETAWARIELELRTIFPELAQVRVSDRWSGRIGSVLDRMPRMGRLPSAPGVWFTGGWCGHGIPLSVQAGFEIARRITGGRSRERRRLVPGEGARPARWPAAGLGAAGLPGGPGPPGPGAGPLRSGRPRVREHGHHPEDGGGRPDEGAGLRLHRRGRRLGGLRARRPTVRRRIADGAAAGGRRRSAAPGIAVPALYSRLFRSSADWAYRTEPQPELNRRRLFWPRGRMLGGSSAMNDMVYVRGNAGRLRRLGGGGQPRLGPRIDAARTSAAAEARLWEDRGADRRRAPVAGAADRGLPRRRRAGRTDPERRLQRTCPGRGGSGTGSPSVGVVGAARPKPTCGRSPIGAT